MAAVASTQPAMLQSKDHGELLDVIDQLRSHGVDHHVPLPQLVVCGDQSSGKSSVLEAVSGVQFPTKDTLCTRFATELILRRAPTANVKVSIRPGKDRSEAERKHLNDFRAPTDDIDELPKLVEAAKVAMGINSESRAFGEDILRVEVSGPGKPHLTLVDLPGLFHAPSKQQSAGDAKLVQSLVRSYMSNERSIILAVVSAKNDYANQVVTGLAREIDPKGLRTMGIITKPDTLIVGSDSEISFMNLAKNEDVCFRLGWHCLVNRDFDTKDLSLEERDQIEKDFFSKGIWTSIVSNVLGIGALKPRLSKVLQDQIISVLPSLLQDVHAGISDCQNTLNRLGASRQSIHQQRLYLIHISRDFSSLIKAAVDGVYDDGFFGDALNESGYSKRIRAVVQNLLLEFSEAMRENGQNQVIMDDGIERAKTSRDVSRSDFLDDVRELMIRSRGRELPGTFNPLIIGDLFFKQSRPWKGIVDQYSEKLLDAVRTLVELAVTALADDVTSEGLLQEILYPATEKSSFSLQEKVAEIILPHQSGHPITYNHYFTETIQKAREERDQKDLTQRVNSFFGLPPDAGPSKVDRFHGLDTGRLLNALSQSTEADMDRHACSEAVDCMEAYYKVAMKLLVDNFSVLAVESCILSVIPNILSPSTVMELDDDTITKIAAETEDSLATRHQATRKLETLKSGLKTLNRLSRHHMKVKPADSEPDEESIMGSMGNGYDHESTRPPTPVEEFRERSPSLPPPALTPVPTVWPKASDNLEELTIASPTVIDDDAWRSGNFLSSSKKGKKKKNIVMTDD